MSARTRFLGKLSPDLRLLHEKAEKFVDENLYKRALKVFKKLEEYLPGDMYITDRIRELNELERQGEGPVAEGSRLLTGVVGETESLLKELLRDLELDEIRQGYGDLSAVLQGVVELEDTRFRRVAMDASVFAGVSNNWQLALDCVERLKKLGDETSNVVLWKLRCLVELEKFPEVVAIFSSQRWGEEQLLHANFLVGVAYEGLGVRDQAKLRFEAVSKMDPSYRKVAQKLLNY
ncbi:MAG: hypothetical protein ABIR96_09225 [Bdellovibrionota bacterium]